MISTSVTKDAIDCVALAVTIFNVLVYCPTIIYYLIIYRNYEKKEKANNTRNVLHQRNSLLVYIINIIAIITTCTERIFMASSEVWGIIDVPFWSVSLALAATWFAIMDLFAIKVYLLHYQQQLNQSIADRLWKKHINPGIDDWYILNKNKYGDSLYLIKITFIPYLISITIDTGLIAILPIIRNISHCLLASIPICIALYVFYKSRKINDVYRIRNEIGYQLIILLTTLFIWIIIVAICHYVIGKDFAHRHTDNIHRFEWMTYLFITDSVTFALALFSTLYPLYLCIKRKRSKKKHKYKLCKSKSDSSAQTRIEELTELIADYKLFKALMDFLIGEFCTENLLFIVELYQIKLAFQEKHEGVIRLPNSDILATDLCNVNFNRNNYHVYDFNTFPYEDTAGKTVPYAVVCCGSANIKLILPSELPQSYIKEQNESFMDQLQNLYAKYIKEGSNFELNISAESRRKLSTFFESIEKIPKERYTDLYCVFDECCVEILFLLDGPFQRFVNENENMKSSFSMSEIFRPEISEYEYDF